MSRKQLELYRRTVAVPGRSVALSVVDLNSAGADAPCGIFLHGAGGNLTQWHNQMLHFSPRMRVLAFDFRGHGCSEFPDSQYDVTELVDDLAALLPTLDVPSKFFLLGHSFGGAVAAHYAVRHPERLQGLALVATAGEIRLSAFLSILLKLPNFALGPIQKMIRNSISTPISVLKKLMPHVMGWDGWELYPQISVPSLVVSGELDRLTRPKEMSRMSDLLQDSWLERISFAGHLPHLERPARVNEVLDAFMFGSQKASWRGRQSVAP